MRGMINGEVIAECSIRQLGFDSLLLVTEDIKESGVVGATAIPLDEISVH